MSDFTRFPTAGCIALAATIAGLAHAQREARLGVDVVIRFLVGPDGVRIDDGFRKQKALRFKGGPTGSRLVAH